MPAQYTKPTQVPLWGMTTLNILDPPAGKKDDGWDVDEVPPSPYENWRTKTVAQWFQWFDERVADGTYGINPEESFVLSGNATPCLEITEDGPVVLTDAMSFAADLSAGAGLNPGGTVFVITADQLVDLNTGLYYDRVANEWIFKINDSIAQWVVDEDGRMRLNNLPTSGPPAHPTIELLDRRGGDASGKRWDIYADGNNNSLFVESFSQAGVSDGVALRIDSNLGGGGQWDYILRDLSVFRPTTTGNGLIGHPSYYWSALFVDQIFEAFPQYLYAEGSGANFPIVIASGASASIMPDNEIENQGIVVNLNGAALELSVNDDGMYKIDATIQMDNGLTAGTRLQFFLAKNTVQIPNTGVNYSTRGLGAGDFECVSMSWIVPILSTDVIELICNNPGGGAVASVQIELRSKVTVTTVRRDP